MLQVVGSNPIARSENPSDFSWLYLQGPRLHYFSKLWSGLIEQVDRAAERFGGEVHVPHRQREVGMSREFLNRFGVRATHR
jgi:hypothetical protein